MPSKFSLKISKPARGLLWPEQGLRDSVCLFTPVYVWPCSTFTKRLPMNAETLLLSREHFHTNRSTAQMTKIKMYFPVRLAVLFKTISVWFCFQIAMETPLKGFNTIYCVKLKKKSVSPVLGNKASQFLPTSYKVWWMQIVDQWPHTAGDWAFWESFLEISGLASFRCTGKQSWCQRNDNLLWCAGADLLFRKGKHSSEGQDHRALQ